MENNLKGYAVLLCKKKLVYFGLYSPHPKSKWTLSSTLAHPQVKPAAIADPAPLGLWALLPREAAVELGPWLISVPTWRPVGSLRGPSPWSVGYKQHCDMVRLEPADQPRQHNRMDALCSAAPANYFNDPCDAFSSLILPCLEVNSLTVSTFVFVSSWSVPHHVKLHNLPEDFLGCDGSTVIRVFGILYWGNFQKGQILLICYAVSFETCNFKEPKMHAL